MCQTCHEGENYQWNMTKGGKRKGAGRKQKYGEATITVAFRIPKSKKEQVVSAVQQIIKPQQ